MGALITRQRLARLGSFASTQLAVQVIGFGSGIVLVRYMEQAQYGYYTLAVSMASMAIIFTDLGLATAVMALGGRLLGQPRALGGLVADANALHRRMAWLSFAVLVPCFALLLLRQKAPPWQVAALTVTILATAVLTARTGVALSIARLLGHVGLQQKLDLGTHLVKLGLLMAATWLTLDATLACLVNLGVAAVGFAVFARHLDKHIELPTRADGMQVSALKQQVWRQGPNSVYYVLSSQVALWLIGIFGSAERVADMGALTRLAALFTVIAAVSAALVWPYFAREDRPAELAAGFASVNTFYAALLASLVALSVAFPAPLLWVLGSGYGGLHAELVWMVVSATLWTWGSTVYGIGSARGWVTPVGWMASTGVLGMALVASAVDLSTVRGSFMVHAAAGFTSTVVACCYFSWQLRRHTRLRAITQGSA